MACSITNKPVGLDGQVRGLLRRAQRFVGGKEKGFVVGVRFVRFVVLIERE